MAGNPLKHTDFAEEGWIKDHAGKELEEFAEEIKIVRIGLQETAKEFQKTFNTPMKVDTIAALRAHNLEIKNAKDLSISYEKVKQAEVETDKKIAQAAAAASVQRKTEIQEKKAQLDLNNKIAKGKKEEIGAYQKLSQELNANRKIVKDLLASKKELTEADQELIKKTQELDKELKEIDGTVGQNQRNVGAYKEMLNDARAELGAFGGGIGKLINSMKELHEQNEKATSSTQKFGNAMKLAGATLLLAAVMALIKGFELLKEASGQLEEEMEVMNAKFKNFFITLASGSENFKESAKLTEEWVISLQKGREEARALGLEIQGLNRRLEEQNSIAGDVTIGYNERIEAQKKAIELEAEIAKKQQTRAQNELRIVENEMNAMRVALGGGKLSNEMYEKEAEAIKKVDEAMGKVALLELEDSARMRQLNIEKTDQLIDLTLKNKEAAHARKTILEEELKDQSLYISTRRKINEELFSLNKKTVQEELKIFMDGRKVQFDANKLLHEQNEILLKDKIEAIRTAQGHGLDAAGVVELAKIVKQYQESEIENMKTLNALAKEEMKIDEKIADIKREISIIKTNDELHDSIILGKQKQEAYDKSNKELLEKQNIWDFKLQQTREANFKLMEAQEENSLEVQKKLLEEKEKDAEIKANNKITDTKELNAEILKLQTQLAVDLENLQIDADLKQKQLAEKKAEDDRKLRNERIDAEMHAVEQINEGIKQGLEKRAQIQQLADQKDIDMHTRMIDVQAQLAAGGRANSLAAQEAAATKAEEKKVQDAKRAAKMQENLAIIDTFAKTLSAALQSNHPFPQAFGEALGSTGLVTAVFAKLFAGYATGVENIDGPGDGKSDSILARLSKGESVATAEATEKNPGLVTAMNNNKVSEFFEKVYLPNYYSANSSVTGIIKVTHDEKLAAIIDDRFTSLEKAVISRPVQHTNLGRIGEWTEEITQQSMRKIIYHKQSVTKRSLRLNG